MATTGSLSQITGIAYHLPGDHIRYCSSLLVFVYSLSLQVIASLSSSFRYPEQERAAIACTASDKGGTRRMADD